MSLPFKISQTHLDLQDKHIDFDSLTETVSETPFKLKLMASQTYEKERNVQMDITVEIDKDLEVILRRNYHIIDLLSDIGGVQAIVFSLIAFILSIFNYQHFDTHMASQLFKVQKQGLDKYSGDFELFSPTFAGNTKEFFVDLCCRRCAKKGIFRKSKQ